jgi:hypothetical protein
MLARIVIISELGFYEASIFARGDNLVSEPPVANAGKGGERQLLGGSGIRRAAGLGILGPRGALEPRKIRARA